MNEREECKKLKSFSWEVNWDTRWLSKLSFTDVKNMKNSQRHSIHFFSSLLSLSHLYLHYIPPYPPLPSSLNHKKSTTYLTLKCQKGISLSFFLLPQLVVVVYCNFLPSQFSFIISTLTLPTFPHCCCYVCNVVTQSVISL